MLNKIVIENYRSCLKTTFECHPKLSVLIGPNGSGKTNILQAIMFLKKMTNETSHNRFRNENAPLKSKLNCNFKIKNCKAILRSTVNYSPEDSNEDTVIGTSQNWTVKNEKGKEHKTPFPMFLAAQYKRFSREQDLLFVKDSNYYRRYFNISMKNDDPDWVKDVISNIASYCNGIKYYSASQFTNPGKCPVSFSIAKEEERSRGIGMQGHTQTLYSIYKAQKYDKSGRYAQFIDVIGPNGLGLIKGIDFKEISISSTEYSVRVGGNYEKRKREKLLVIPKIKIGRQVLSPNQLSEGTFKTISLLFNIITADSTVLLIEEPEVCVHQGLLSSILSLIKKYSEMKQIILSTHSDYVLDHVSPENVFTVKYNRIKGTEVHHIRKTMTRQEYAALKYYLQHEGNLGEYWREGGLEAAR